MRLQDTINIKGLFKKLTIMKGGKNKTRDYTKDEAMYLIYKRYEDAELKLIDMLISTWQGNSDTEKYYRLALSNIKNKRLSDS